MSNETRLIYPQRIGQQRPVICEYCGRVNPPGTLQCEGCGAPLPQSSLAPTEAFAQPPALPVTQPQPVQAVQAFQPPTQPLPMTNRQLSPAVRLVYFLFVGVFVAIFWLWAAILFAITIVGIPVSLALIRTLPVVATLQRPGPNGFIGEMRDTIRRGVGVYKSIPLLGRIPYWQALALALLVLLLWWALSGATANAQFMRARDYIQTHDPPINTQQGLNWLDTFILLSMFSSMVTGFLRGFVRQAASIIGLVVGIVLAGRYYEQVATFLNGPDGHGLVADPNWARIIGFIAIVILVSIVATVIGSFIHRALGLLLLDWLDKALGAFLGLLMALAGIMALLVVATIFPVPAFSDTIKESSIAQWLSGFTPIVLAMLPAEFQHFPDLFHLNLPSIPGLPTLPGLPTPGPTQMPTPLP